MRVQDKRPVQSSAQLEYTMAPKQPWSEAHWLTRWCMEALPLAFFLAAFGFLRHTAYSGQPIAGLGLFAEAKSTSP